MKIKLITEKEYEVLNLNYTYSYYGNLANKIPMVTLTFDPGVASVEGLMNDIEAGSFALFTVSNGDVEQSYEGFVHVCSLFLKMTDSESHVVLTVTAVDVDSRDADTTGA